MKHREHPSNPILEAIRQAQEIQCQQAYQKALQREKMLLRERQRKNEALTQKLFFANELEKRTKTSRSS